MIATPPEMAFQHIEFFLFFNGLNVHNGQVGGWFPKITHPGAVSVILDSILAPITKHLPIGSTVEVLSAPFTLCGNGT